MKLRTLTIHNIASISDAEICFDSAPLDGADVFLISGETGAGKSTILDAICLALFDAVPRLGTGRSEARFNDISSKDYRQLLRSGTSEGFVELSFRGNDGHEYVARWRVWRTKKKIYDQWTLVVDGDTATALSKKGQIEARINVALNIDYDQFVRTSMLAQGEFTRFLDSDDASKARILEKLTGASYFAKIGAEIYRLASEKEATVRSLRMQAEGVRLLTEDEISTIVGRQAEIAEGIGKLSGAMEAKSALSSLVQARAELAGLARECEDMRRRWQSLRAGHDAMKKSYAEATTRLSAMRGELSAERERYAVYEHYEEVVGLLSEIVASLRTSASASAMIVSLRETIAAKTVVPLEDAKKALAEAEQKSAEADELFAALDFGHKEWAVIARGNLTPGCECPVCRQRVATMPPMESVLNRQWTKARDEAKTAREAVKTARKVIADMQEVVTLKARIEDASATIASALTAIGSARERLEQIPGLTGMPEVDRVEDYMAFAQAFKAGHRECEGRLEAVRVAEADVRRYETILGGTQTAMESILAVMPEWSGIEAGGAVVPSDSGALQTYLVGRTRSLSDKRIAAKATELRHLAWLERFFENEGAYGGADVYAGIVRSDAEIVAEVSGRLAAVESEMASLNREAGALEQQLSADGKARRELDELFANIRRAEGEAERYQRLNRIFGDKNGDTFRNIALSFVLKNLLESANKYLAMLSDRYRLAGVEGSYLILLEDAYNGYMRRPVVTSSGGESFMVSLSLALALADLGTSFVADTLFIDEGFGTLSGEPLRRAVGMLRSLNRMSGRRVGIISHVAELKSELPVQIRVERQAGAEASTVTVEG